MRPILLTAAAMAVAVGVAPAHAAPRVDDAPYRLSGVQGVADGSVGAQGTGSGPAVFATRRNERTVTLQLADSLGTVVHATVKQPTGAPGQYVLLGTFCGATQNPLRLTLPGQPVIVAPVAGTCEGKPSIPSTGQAHAEFQ